MKNFLKAAGVAIAAIFIFQTLTNLGIIGQDKDIVDYEELQQILQVMRYHILMRAGIRLILWSLC